MALRSVVILLLMLQPTVAKAHDSWINWGGYRAPTGEHCCGDDDCHMLDATTIKITPRGYGLPNGEVVPYSEAQSSEDGNYWRCRRYDGSRRCFFAPSPGT